VLRLLITNVDVTLETIGAVYTSHQPVDTFDHACAI
jgi:hypothetical protein